ncbi:MAG: GntR family transcriptional regulator [Burkholderiaceae bacterium]
MTVTAQHVAAMVESLEDDIVFGRLAPWQELVEDALIARFDAKRHAVRAAITLLVERGLVIKPPNKTARVKDLGVQEVQWLYQMRMLLSASAVDLLPEVPDPAVVRQLKAVQAEYRRAIDAGSPRQIRIANDRFHDLLFGMTQNPLLSEELRRYTRMTDPIRSTGMVDAAWLKQAVKEHDAMIRALDKNDRTALKALVLGHMQPVRDRWLHNRQARVINED